MTGFDYNTLLWELGHLGAERNDDRVDLPIDYLRAITIAPGCDEDSTYLVNITTWDEGGNATDRPVGETGDITKVVELVENAYYEIEDDMRREDEAWCSLNTEEGSHV